MNPVCTFIEFIKELTNDEYSECIEYLPSDIYFKNGGCYELVKTLKHFLSDGEVWIRNDGQYCALYYKGILYDIDGIIEDNTLYHKATKIDMDCLEDELLYGRIEIKFNHMTPSVALINNILDCRIEPLIEKCQQMSDEPNYYSQSKIY